MSKQLAVDHLLLRGGTGSEWAAANPVLMQNEIGIERSNDGSCKIKIGDGTTAWNDLKYYDSTPQKISDVYAGTIEPTDGAMLWVDSDFNMASGNGIILSSQEPASGAMIWIEI